MVGKVECIFIWISMAMVDGELELAWSPYMGASSKAQPATCGRGMVARVEGPRKEVNGHGRRNIGHRTVMNGRLRRKVL